MAYNLYQVQMARAWKEVRFNEAGYVIRRCVLLTSLADQSTRFFVFCV